MESSFVIIKPDGIQQGLIGKIITRFEDKGFKICHVESRWKSKDWVCHHYAEQHGEILEGLIRAMAGTHLIGVTLYGEDALRIVRRMVGATDSREALPGTIRGDFGTYPIHCNIVHASASTDAYYVEKELFFDRATDLGARK